MSEYRRFDNQFRETEWERNARLKAARLTRVTIAAAEFAVWPGTEEKRAEQPFPTSPAALPDSGQVG